LFFPSSYPFIPIYCGFEGVDAGKSQAYGPGLQGGATKEPTNFTIVANNRKGDPVGSGGDRFDVKITDPYGAGTRLLSPHFLLYLFPSLPYQI
jgi:Filamin/ABP280 repeat